jgi:hypothetical protein
MGLLDVEKVRNLSMSLGSTFLLSHPRWEDVGGHLRTDEPLGEYIGFGSTDI